MSDPRPIGLFDSGVGGLTVSRQVFRLMPGESTVYFGDNAHVPYGPRSPEELIGFAGSILTFLVSCGVKYVIFACNTNSSISLPVVRELYAVPMIGLIEPGVREAVRVSTGGRIGVIATEA
ncbi:MAG: glutamate racemase, partial [Desulfofundulus sp.]